MSKDILIRQTCPHRTVREWLAIDEDRQTLRPVRNPASSSLQVVWNGMDLPATGLQGPAKFRGSLSAPFNIITGVNDKLLVQVSGQDYDFTLPSGSRVPIQTLLASLTTQIQSSGAPVIVSNTVGALVMETIDTGKAASLFLKGGSGHTTLGLPSRRYYMGTQITSPWRLIQDPLRRIDPTARVVYFQDPFLSEDDIFEMTYITRRESCRRCNALAIEDDFRYDAQGALIFAQGSALLLQEVEKYILTVLGSNPFHNIGSRLTSVIGNKASNYRDLEMFIVQEASQNLKTYQEIKSFQEKYQPVTDLEFLQRVVSIRVFQMDDPTSLVLEIELLSRAGRTEVLRDIVRLPSVLLNFNQSIRVQ